MKKSTIRRLLVLCLCLTLVTVSLIGGTLAKYTTTISSEDSARVAIWGFTNTASMDITGLFSTAYTTDSGMTAAADAIAPGTTNSATFKFTYDGTAAPEVAYSLTVDTTGSTIADGIKNNTSIQWKLDSGEWGTWDTMIGAIKALSGDASGTKNYAPGEQPAAFPADDTVHTISWQWVFENSNDTADTALGNKADLDSVTLKIAITATQLDTAAATGA